MRLAISNIAWDVHEDENVVTLLQRFGVDAIDIAPGKYFPEPARASIAEVHRVKLWWSDRGIQITGMQALLFGTAGLNVFGPPDIQSALLHHMTAICRIGAELGATRLVFGSPRNRDRAGLSDEQAITEGVAFFSRLGDIALSHGVMICLEPNPSCYGANFMTTSAETAFIVQSTDHPAIRMQLDTGALAINGESMETVLQKYASVIGHVHASEPNLVPLGDVGTDHVALHRLMTTYIPGHLVSIEMLATKDEPHIVAIERALACAVRCYCPAKDSRP
ncbi:sugar phosphate isomerase/epimerase [Cupriavidus gilardii]|nr:sugar phosphate isomerase/epimerase [Cupriavidus gilardii]